MAAQTGAGSLVESAVLEAARRVFAARGFDGASVDAVAAEAGLTKGAVYSRFASKEALFIAAALRHDEEVLGDIAGTSVGEWARAWAAALDDARPWTLLGMEFRLYGLRHPTAADRTRDWQRASHQRLREAIERRVEDAGMRLRVDADVAVSILAAAAAGLAQQQHTDPDIDAEQTMATVIELLVEPR